MTDEQLERVARAIHAADECGNNPRVAWDDDAEGNRNDYRILAAAALKVLGNEIRPRVIVLHMVYPDGTHTGDCEGCLWSQEQPT